MLKKHYRPPDQLKFNLKYRSKTLDNIKLPASLDIANISRTESTQPVYENLKYTRKIPPRTESLSSSSFSTNTSTLSSNSGVNHSISGQSFKNLTINKSRSKESLDSSITADTDSKNPLQCRRYCKKVVEKTSKNSSRSATTRVSRARSFKDYFKLLKDKPMTRESSYIAFEDQCPFDNFEKLSARPNSLTLPRSHKTSNTIRSKVKITRKNSDSFHNIDNSDRRSSGYTSNSSNESLSEFSKPSLLSLPSSSLKSSKSSVTTDSEHSFSILKKDTGRYGNRNITSSSGGSIDDDDTKPIEFKLHYKNQFCTLTQTSTANLLSARTTPASTKKAYAKSPLIMRAKSFNMDSRLKSFRTRSDSFNNFKYMKPKWV